MNIPGLESPNRRDFLRVSSLLAVMSSLQSAGFAAEGAQKSILLRSSWQTVNIGDIAHTPGILRILEEFLPNVEIRLWPSKIDNGVEDLLRQRFPKLSVVKPNDTNQLKRAFEECHFLLHGSGASLVAQKHVEKWHAETKKPFGVYGITFPRTGSTATKPASDSDLAKTIEILNAAKFVFFRDSESMQLAKSLGCVCPIMEFGPDAAFGVDLKNESAADKFLNERGLTPGQFLCCIPRLRYTPYWLIHPERAKDETKQARNEAMKEHDHRPLREAIIQVVRQTAMKVLVCPEDQSQMAVGKELLVDPLPDDVKPKVVWRETYWLTDEAVSVHQKSAGLFGLEMHSPIMCIGRGVPAIVCRFSEQTSKGLMWRDIGLADWLFDMDREEDVARIVPTVLELARDPQAARKKAETAREFARKRQRETMAIVAANL